MGERTIDLDPRSIVTHDGDLVSHHEFGGYDISPEDVEEIKRREQEWEMGKM